MRLTSLYEVCNTQRPLGYTAEIRDRNTGAYSELRQGSFFARLYDKTRDSTRPCTSIDRHQS